jgi:IclR family pca regulon transcriptional regulator
VHAAETAVEKLRGEYLPMLLDTAGRISADFALRDALPHTVARSDSP